MFLNKKKKIHFVGIKGSGMSALAQILHDVGYKVKGSDVNKRFFTQEKLEKRNIPITTFDKRNINSKDIIVASRAFDEKNVEVEKGLTNNEFYYYYDFLGRFAETFPISIAISGSHGKTTTTGLISHTLSKLAPTSYLIGDGTGNGVYDSQYFAFEACEYKNHFHSYNPDYAIVTNIDFDHPDFFKNIKDVVNSFQLFVKKVKKAIVVFGDQQECTTLETSAKMWKYGFSETNEIYAKNIKITENGTDFDVYEQGKMLGTVSIPLYGRHQVLNTLSVISVLRLEGYSFEDFKDYFMEYSGVQRRFNETKIGSNIVVDDYAHHPSEINATLETIRMKYPNKKAVVIFQPHTYSRTKALVNEFAESLSGFDETYVVDIFSSEREKKKGENVTSGDIVERINDNKAYYIDFGLTKEILEYENTVVSFLGAGDINKLKDTYLEQQTKIINSFDFPEK